MRPARHTLTATRRGGAVVVTMASIDDVALSSQLGWAADLIEENKVVNDKGQPITREPSQKAAILLHLRAVKSQVDNLRDEYVQAGQPEAFDTFIKPRLAASIGQLSRLARYKPEIISLKPLIMVGRPRYIPRGWDIRKYLYDATTGGAWRTLSASLRRAHLTTLGPRLYRIWLLREDKSRPGNDAAAEAQWRAMQAAREIPSPRKAPAFATYDHARDFPKLEYETDHRTSLGMSWNAGEKNRDDNVRRTTTLDPANLRVVTEEENQERSKDKTINPDFDRDVGPDFSSVVAHSPKGSAVIDGMLFDEKP